MFARLFTLLVLGAMFSSCSSIMTGTTQNVTITSNVNGATVMVNGNMVGRTPVTARVKREDKMHYIVQKEGYEVYQSTMPTKLDPWFWGNIIIGGVLGSTTDFGLGSTNKIDPDNLYVELAPIAKAEKEEDGEPSAPAKKKPSKDPVKEPTKSTKEAVKAPTEKTATPSAQPEEKKE